jgi:hypothetical protein
VTTDPVTPLRVARVAVEVCVRALPTWEQRLRYRTEFLADLQGLPPSDQLRYAVGVLSQTLALRAALGASAGRVEVAATQPHIPFARRFRCRVLRWHDWRGMSNPDGERYRACTVCGREEIDQPPGGVVGSWGGSA